MKGELRISEKNPVVWIPKVILDAGFKGKVPFLVNCYTVVLLHPKATLPDIEKSLEIIREDVRLRGKLELTKDETKG
jgi:hypothetical protein